MAATCHPWREIQDYNFELSNSKYTVNRKKKMERQNLKNYFVIPLRRNDTFKRRNFIELLICYVFLKLQQLLSNCCCINIRYKTNLPEKKWEDRHLKTNPFLSQLDQVNHLKLGKGYFQKTLYIIERNYLHGI